MPADDTRGYLLSINATSEETLFGPDVLVYKINPLLSEKHSNTEAQPRCWLL
jgi:hypothetical protein|tara:strand:+ start:3205 stop:3360 length:156 start_codon:yes stop_codon:yes gene_type:complete